MAHIAFITAEDRSEAEEMGRTLVEEGLAACANVLPDISSTYRWKGEVEESEESLLLVKTSDERLEELIARVEEIHSYEVPEVIALEIGRGSEEYIKWLEESVHEPRK